MIFQTLIVKLIDHLLMLLLNPATCEHGLYRVNELKNNSSGLFVAIEQQVEKKFIDGCADMAINERTYTMAKQIASMVNRNEYGLFKDFPINVKRRIDEKKNEAKSV